MQSTLLPTIPAAKYLGFKPGTLEVWRCLGRGPRYKRIGRKVFYDIHDLEEFANAVTVETNDSREFHVMRSQ